jgi:hypothetical protein
MVHVAVLPALSVTISWTLRAEMVGLAAISVKAIEKGNSCVAPGSPLMAAPLLVDTLLAMYVLGNVNGRLPPLASENVSFDEFDVPVMVSVATPALSTLFALSMVTNSGLPACVTCLTTSSQLAALNVMLVLRALRPVLSVAAVTFTVSLPLPDVLLGVSHDA